MGATQKNVTGIDPQYVSQEVRYAIYRVDVWEESRASYESRLEIAESIDDALARAEANRHGR